MQMILTLVDEMRAGEQDMFRVIDRARLGTVDALRAAAELKPFEVFIETAVRCYELHCIVVGQ